MKRHSFIILGLLLGLLPVAAAAQSKLQGIVLDLTTNEPIAGVVVKSKNAFTSSDAEGQFTLTLKDGADSVTFRCMGYETLTKSVKDDLTRVYLGQKATRLKDVIVQAPDIYARGDTLVFNVSRYANAKDDAIIDVIKRLPGVKVEEDGTIMYQGKPINKFYIDGNDFIGGQYGLATNNISHKDVQSVEVMENHQPVKALEGIEFPEEAGINLRLKEDARSRWVGVAQAGGGYEPALYSGSLFAMRIARKMQNMFTLKADNTGWNPATQVVDHNDYSGMFSDDYNNTLWPEYISAGMISAPLAEKRTRDNLSWIANGITAWRRGDTSMRLKMNYMGDRLDYSSGFTTNYFSSLIPDFTQNEALRTRTHDLSAQLNSETNKRGYFLKDKLTLGAVWEESDAVITGSSNVGQRVNRKDFSAVNDLKLVKRSDTRLFTLMSRNGFRYRPDRLAVSGDENAVQRVGTTDFRSTTETEFGRMSRFWNFSVTGGIDLDYHRMNTALTGLSNFDNTDIYESFLSDLYVTPQVRYERNSWRLTLKSALRWRHYGLKGRHDYADVAPSFHAFRQLTSKSDLSARVSYRLGAPMPYLLIDNPVLADYRDLFIAAQPDKYSQSTSASATYRYRNPLKSVFANVSLSYTHRRTARMSNQIFAGDMIITTYADRLNNQNVWTANAGVSKGLGHSRMVVGCDASGTMTAASSMREGEMIPYRQTAATIAPYYRGSITQWLSVDYKAKYTFSEMTVNGDKSDYHAVTQTLYATLIPHDRVNISIGAEHYLTHFVIGDNSNLVLFDASASWQATTKLRLILTADNLLDKRLYRYETYGTLSGSTHWFRLRPRTLLLSAQLRF